MAEDSNVGTIAERAARMGHVSLDQFRGNPDNWVDAETFVKRAEESLPYLKGTLKTMEQKMADQDRLLRDTANELSGVRSDLQEFVQFSKSAEQRAYDKAVKDIRVEQTAAKEAGDMPAFVAATEKLDAVIADHPAVTGADVKPGATSDQKPKPWLEQYNQWMTAEPTAYDDWKKENDWVIKEPEMFAYAEQMDRYYQNQEGFTISRSKRLEKVAEMVKKKFPEYFGNPAKKRGSPVEGDTGGQPGGNGKNTYHDLPDEAKKICDKWTGKDGKGTGTLGKGFTRDDYLKSYRW